MQLVIDIPDKDYEHCKMLAETIGEVLIHHSPSDRIKYFVGVGTLLPEHHGDLADKGDIIHDIDCDEEMRLGKNVEWVREVIRNAPTVIKASGEGAEG